MWERHEREEEVMSSWGRRKRPHASEIKYTKCGLQLHMMFLILGG